MTDVEIIDDLKFIADNSQRKIEGLIPEDCIERLALFVETVRVVDFVMLSQFRPVMRQKIGITRFEMDMIEMGWNLASSLLLKEGRDIGFPMMESTEITRTHAMSLLYNLGLVTQVRRLVDMARAHLVKIEKAGNTYIFSQSENSNSQFLDYLEYQALERLENILKSGRKSFNDWKLVNRENMQDMLSKVGNFSSVQYHREFDSFRTEGLDLKMLPLIKKWDLGRGVMIVYDSTPEIDNHFLAIASELGKEWRDETGIHPKTIIGNTTAGEIMSIAIIVASLHLKHISFVQAASKKHGDVSIPQSLPIWTEVKKLAQDISDFSGIDLHTVTEALNSITLKSSDCDFLRAHTSKFRPLLIDIGSGFVLRPTSSILRNPFNSMYAILKSRDLSFENSTSVLREAWMRDHLYALYAGNRYQRVEGNIKIRKSGQIITDIDAAIYDNLTGELALIQIKWQNYFSNDVKEIRSRARNFIEEINKWEEKMSCWIHEEDTNQIIKSLKLKGVADKLKKSGVYLFALSKNAARMQGYGYKLNNDRIAIGNWRQFVRIRTEIGPADFTIGKLFQNLKAEENSKIKSVPIPIKVPFGEAILEFKDIWSFNKSERNEAVDDSLGII